jgi:hypothetical protein
MSKSELEKIASDLLVVAGVAIDHWNNGNEELAIAGLTGFVRGLASALGARAAAMKEEVKP